jgi:hypothetical protein
MLDWSAFAPNSAPGAKGVNALKAVTGGSPGMFVARTLGGEPNQVATPGRRTLVGYGISPAYNFQTLLQDITMGGTSAAPFLKQSFIPELATLRESATATATGQQFEVVATLTKPPEAVPFVVTSSNTNHQSTEGSTPWKCIDCAYFTVLGYTKIGVSFDADIVFVDTSAQPPLVPPCEKPPCKPLPNLGVRAGPLCAQDSFLLLTLTRFLPSFVIVWCSG